VNDFLEFKPLFNDVSFLHTSRETYDWHGDFNLDYQSDFLTCFNGDRFVTMNSGYIELPNVVYFNPAPTFIPEVNVIPMVVLILIGILIRPRR